MAGKFISPFFAESVQQVDDDESILAPTPDMLLYDESTNATGGKEDQLLNDSLSEMDNQHTDQFDDSLDENGQIDISLAVKLAEKELTTCDPDQCEQLSPNEEKQSSNPLKEVVNEKVEPDAIEEKGLKQPEVKVMPVFGKKRKGSCKPVSMPSKEKSTILDSVSKESKKPNYEESETVDKCTNEKQKKQTKKLTKEQKKTEIENKTAEKEVKKMEMEKEKERVQQQKKAGKEKKLAEKEAKKMEMEQRRKELEREREHKKAEKENKKEVKKVEMEQRKKEKEKQQELKKVEKEKKLADKEAKKAELEQRRKEKERQQEQKKFEIERKKAELEQKKMERELKRMEKDAEKQSVKGKQKENDKKTNITESSKESECVQSYTETNSDMMEKVIDMSPKEQPEMAAKSSSREEIQSTLSENDVCQQVPDMCNSPKVDVQGSESKGSPSERENSNTKTKFSAPTKKGFKQPRQAIKKGGSQSDKKTDSDKTKVEATKNKSKLTVEKVCKRKSSSLWVQCDIPECSKWRKLKDCIDPSQLPEKWDCSLNPDPDFNKCSAKEEDAPELSESQEFLYTSFVPGCIVWAKLVGYPWWPAMLEEDPDEECYYEMNEKRTFVTKYHVVFFDTPVCRAWVPSESVAMFNSDVDRNKDTTVPKKYTRALKYAVGQAKAALQLSIEERIAKFSFSKCYKKGKRSRLSNEDEEEIQVTKKCRTHDQDGNKSDDSTYRQ